MLSRSVFYALTPGCERIDVITEKVSDVPESKLTRRVTVFDHDGLTAQVPPVNDPPSDPNLINYLITETLRQAANFQTVIVRDDWLLGVVAIQTVHLHLYQLFAEANKPQPPTGPKQWSRKLSPRHRDILQKLPVPQPTPDSVLEARQAALTVFLQEAPTIAANNNIPWPAPLADAVLAHLDRSGLPLESPRTR